MPSQPENSWKNMMETYTQGYEHGQKGSDPELNDDPDYMEGHAKGVKSIQDRVNELGKSAMDEMGRPGNEELSAMENGSAEWGDSDGDPSNDLHEATDDWVGLMSEDQIEYMMQSPRIAKHASCGCGHEGEGCDCGSDCDCEECQEEDKMDEKEARARFVLGPKRADMYLNDAPVVSDATPENYYEMTPPIFPIDGVPSEEEILADAPSKSPDMETVRKDENVVVAYKGNEYELVHINKVAMKAELFDNRTGQFLTVDDTQISEIS